MTYTPTADEQVAEEYALIFGRNPEAWREPLGALRMTLWDDNPPEWQLERARNEVEWLTRVLNGVKPEGNQWTRMKGMGVEAGGEEA